MTDTIIDKSENPVLLFDGGRGIYIPEAFFEEVNFQVGTWEGVTEYARENCSEGPDNPDYWDYWNDVLNNAVFTDNDGSKWHLHQDGDLWLICYEAFTDEQYEEFFGEPREGS